MQLSKPLNHVHKQATIDNSNNNTMHVISLSSNDVLKALSYPQGLKLNMCITASDPKECSKGLMLWFSQQGI